MVTNLEDTKLEFRYGGPTFMQSPDAMVTDPVLTRTAARESPQLRNAACIIVVLHFRGGEP